MRVFITGTAGFIGFHLARLLLEEGVDVHGYDGLTDYYDVALKRRRHALLAEYPAFGATIAMLEDDAALQTAVDAFAPDVIVHLAAQAGVRYSLENPRAYIDSNVVGTLNVIEAARRRAVSHLLMASTSSVYGGNEDMPFVETEKTDTQPRRPTNRWGMPMPIFGGCRPPCSASSPSMGLGVGRTWPCSNSPRRC